MPRRTDLKRVLVIGSGPIVIGQACEFDYSGTQACKALKEEGYRVVLVNSNPATIMTDPEFADRTYIEPITPECIEKIIVREKDEMAKLGAKGKLGVHYSHHGHAFTAEDWTALMDFFDKTARGMKVEQSFEHFLSDAEIDAAAAAAPGRGSK